jgi:hypothetical protein
MIDDPIIEELHRIREEIAARHNYDVSAIFKYFREKEAKENRPVVSFEKQRKSETTNEMEVQDLAA